MARAARPKATAQLWARIVRDNAILLCVRGRARGPNPADGEYYPDHLTFERETFAALGALRARYADRIAEGGVYYAGFSQGATMGALMLVEHAAEVKRLVFVEGGFKDWSVARARAFREHGGERVLFVCGRTTVRRRSPQIGLLVQARGRPRASRIRGRRRSQPRRARRSAGDRPHGPGSPPATRAGRTSFWLRASARVQPDDRHAVDRP